MGPAVVHAQETSGNQAANNGNALDDIVVTARRREETQQSVPVSITAITPEKIERAGLRSTEDLRTTVPSLNIGGNRRDEAQFYIRGQGPGVQTTGQRNFSSVATYFAEVPVSIAGPGVFYDLANVQVLKGPQGTLFGRNTTGGAVLFEPRRPQDNNSGYVKATYGNYDYKELEWVVNGAVAPGVALRIAGQISRRDGYTRSVITGQDLDERNYEAVRFSLLLNPIVGFENLTIVDYRARDNAGGSSVIRASGGVANFLGTDRYVDIQKGLGARQNQTPELLRSKGLDVGITNKTTYEISDNILLKNIVAFRQSRRNESADYDGTPAEILRNEYVTDAAWATGSDQFNEEFQIQGKVPSIELSYIIGYYHEMTKSPFLQQVPGITLRGLVPGDGYINRRASNRDISNAVFGHLEWNPIEWIGLSGGVRKTWDKRFASLSAYLTNGNCATSTVPTCPTSYNADFSAWSYDATLNLKPKDNILIFGSYRHGYKSGGINLPAPPNGEIFEPEIVNSFEVGLKADWDIGIPLRTNLAAFYDKYKNVQIQENYILGNLTTSNVPSGIRAVNKGVEAEVTIVPTKGFNLSGFFSYLDAAATDTVMSVLNIGRPIVIGGRQFSNQPKYKYGVNGAVDLPIPSEYGHVTASANWSWQSSMFTDNIPGYVISNPSYGLLNARVEWNEFMGKSVDLAVFATNLTNKTYVLGGYPILDLGFDSAIFGEPRMYGVSLKFNFGAR